MHAAPVIARAGNGADFVEGTRVGLIDHEDMELASALSQARRACQPCSPTCTHVRAPRTWPRRA